METEHIFAQAQESYFTSQNYDVDNLEPIEWYFQQIGSPDNFISLQGYNQNS